MLDSKAKQSRNAPSMESSGDLKRLACAVGIALSLVADQQRSSGEALLEVKLPSIMIRRRLW
jgi:hypothetical protein